MTSTANAPTAQGAFAKTPFPHLLVYALDQRLTGTFELAVGEESVATILVVQGFPAKVRITEGVHYLGDVMAELELITAEQLAASLERLQESPRLQGQILIELGAADEARVEAGVKAQLERKLEHLFALPPETIFSYFDGVDVLQRYGGPPTPIDPFPVLWRGIRTSPSWEHVDGTLRRVGSAAVRITPTSQVERFQFGRGEAAAIELLRQKPLRVVDLANAKIIGPSVAQLLVYCLIISKQVDLIEAPVNAPAPVAAPIPPPAPSQPTAFARVQLQAKPIQRSPLIVEEVAVVTRAVDGRIASPMPGPIVIPPEYAVDPPAVPPLTGLDIASMIHTTIQSSMPPAMLAPSMPPTAPGVNPSVVPEAPPSGNLPPAEPPRPAQLTAEQTSLKQKIIDRAAQITAQNYFEMLGLPKDATPEVIQKSFFQLAKVWHPDRLPAALVDVKDACSKVFAHLTEAHATLMDAERRNDYMTLIKDGGATPDDQDKIHSVLEAATEYQKAEFHLKRSEIQQAYDYVKRARSLDNEQPEYLAMMTWIEAMKPEWSGREKTLEKIAVLDQCLKMNKNCERAYFWRGLLYKRIEEGAKAVKDFKKSAELNPRNLDALREVRLFNMRGGTIGPSRPPPGPGSGPAGRASKPPPSEKLGGIFGKLFKK